MTYNVFSGTLNPTQSVARLSLQLKHVSIIDKKLVKQQYLPNMFSECGELRPVNG